MKRVSSAAAWMVVSPAAFDVLKYRLPWRSWLVLPLLAALPFFAEPAAAHAIVIASLPSAGSTVTGPDFDVRVQFNSRIDHKRSRLTLLSADGHTYPVALGENGSDDTLAGHAARIPAGSFRLRWLVLAIDGHLTRGDIPFTVVNP
jgi:methionine-rich copper-binding protein CopC